MTWGSYYMFMHASPLKQYMFREYGQDNSLINFKKFAAVGPLYKAYGYYLIKKYPEAFMKYFVYPNIQRYIYPPGEVYEALTPFYLRDDELGPPVRKWFGLTTLTIPASFIQFRQLLLAPYPILITIVHIVFLSSCIGFGILRRHKRLEKKYLFVIVVAVSLWLCDFLFNILAAAVVLRYLLFIMTIEIAFSLFFIESMLLEE